MKIDKNGLERKVPGINSQSPAMIAIDEFSIKTRHSYGTTVIDVNNATEMYIGKDRREESL